VLNSALADYTNLAGGRMGAQPVGTSLGGSELAVADHLIAKARVAEGKSPIAMKKPVLESHDHGPRNPGRAGA